LNFEAKIKEMGLTIPEVAKPVAAYVPAIRIGDYVYTSGQIPFVEGKLAYAGKLGSDIQPEQGYEAAKVCALNCLAAVKSVLGSLDKIEQIVKVVGFVNSAPGFIEQPKVINGASELVGSIFGKQGEHSRSAVGVAELPINAAVEVEMIIKVKT
jgi:enamine deaminase RidA (YjgF/YER057c/UK114 family)